MAGLLQPSPSTTSLRHATNTPSCSRIPLHPRQCQLLRARRAVITSYREDSSSSGASDTAVSTSQQILPTRVQSDEVVELPPSPEDTHPPSDEDTAVHRSSGPLARALRAYSNWLCQEWLEVSVYGSLDLRQLASTYPAVLIAANHISDLDRPVLTYALHSLGIEQVFCLGEQGLEPGWAHAASLSGLYTLLRVVRSRGFTQKEVDSCALALEARGGAELRSALVLFPERTPGSAEGSMRGFKVSPAYLASKLGLPVVPAFISGTHTALPQHHVIPARTKVAVEFGMFLPPPQDLSTEKDILRLDPEIHLSSTRKTQIANFDTQLKNAMMTLRSTLRAKKRQGPGTWERNKQQQVEADAQAALAAGEAVPEPASKSAQATGGATMVLVAVLMWLLHALDSTRVAVMLWFLRLVGKGGSSS